MNEIKATISEQLRQLQMLMHRASFHNFVADGRQRNPHRGQGRVLSILKLKPEISQKELTYLLGTSKQSLAELLSKLEKSEYITREPSKEDKRVMTIKLTEAGMNASTDDHESDFSDSDNILDCLSDEELVTFSEYLGRMIKRYEELFPDEDFEERRRHMEQFMSRYSHGREFRDDENHREHPHDQNGRFGSHRQGRGSDHRKHHVGYFHIHGHIHDDNE